MLRPVIAVLLALVSSAEPDSDKDGFPDAVELSSSEDRAAFRAWLVAVAVAQARAPDDRWRERDCAGLARFAYREALRDHGAGYALRGLRRAPPADVAAYAFPRVPLLGEALFLVPGADRLPEGARQVGGRTFSPFATGRVLVEGSARRVGSDPSAAEPGDLLFFEREIAGERHLMIVGERLASGERLVVYHTGPDGADPGHVRLVSLSALARHPDTSWHPSADNPRFLGVYRWKILD